MGKKNAGGGAGVRWVATEDGIILKLHYSLHTVIFLFVPISDKFVETFKDDKHESNKT